MTIVRRSVPSPIFRRPLWALTAKKSFGRPRSSSSADERDLRAEQRRGEMAHQISNPTVVWSVGQVGARDLLGGLLHEQDHRGRREDAAGAPPACFVTIDSVTIARCSPRRPGRMPGNVIAVSSARHPARDGRHREAPQLDQVTRVDSQDPARERVERHLVSGSSASTFTQARKGAGWRPRSSTRSPAARPSRDASAGRQALAPDACPAPPAYASRSSARTGEPGARRRQLGATRACRLLIDVALRGEHDAVTRRAPGRVTHGPPPRPRLTRSGSRASGSPYPPPPADCMTTTSWLTSG